MARDELQVSVWGLLSLGKDRQNLDRILLIILILWSHDKGRDKIEEVA